MQDFSRPIPLAHYALLAVAVLGCFFLGIGGFPLFDLDEGAFSEATREMLASGNYLSTTLNGEPRYDKPILIYWLQAASASLFGINEFAFRLPSALAGSGWVIFTYLFVRRAASDRQALAAGIITASALAVSIIVKVATADALLNLLISATLFSAYLFLRFHERKYLYLTFVAMGLGFLTKGPVAVIIPGVVTFLYSALRKDLRGWLALALNGRGIALFFAIAAPWYVTQYLVEGDGFFRGFFLKHNVDRFSAPMESHGGSYFYYVPVLLLSVLPYTTVLLKAFSQWRRIIKDDLQLFLLLWFATVFVIFSFSATKLPHYLIYGYSGVFILMAAYLDELRSRLLAFLPLLLLLAVLLFLPSVIEAAIPHINKPYYREMLCRHPAILEYRVLPLLCGILPAHPVFHGGEALRPGRQTAGKRRHPGNRFFAAAPAPVRRHAAGADQGSRAAGTRPRLHGSDVGAQHAELQRLQPAHRGKARPAPRRHRDHPDQPPGRAARL